MAGLGRALSQLEMRTNGYLTPALTVFLAINTLVFFVQIAGGEGLTDALLCTTAVWSGEVWRLLTGAFAHNDPMHWFFNMLVSAFFAGHVERTWGTRFFVISSLVVAVLANLTFLVLTPLIFPTTPAVLGFSGVVSMWIVARAVIDPHSIMIFIIIRMPIWVFAVVVVGLDLLRLLFYASRGGGQSTAFIVHLAGALLGFLIARYFRQITGIGKAMEARKVRREVEREEATEVRADELLDKVKQEGLASLTDKERQFLVKYSEEQRQKLG